MKKDGHDGAVKLLPRLLSKGRGRDAAAVGAAVAIVDAGDELAEPDDVGARMADELLEPSCLAYRPICGRGGGSLRS